MGLQNDKVMRMLEDEMWSNDEMVTTAASTVEPTENDFENNKEGDTTEIKDKNRYCDPQDIKIYNRDGRSIRRSEQKRKIQSDGEIISKRKCGARQKPSKMKVKSTLPRCVVPSSQKNHAKNLDVIKLIAE